MTIFSLKNKLLQNTPIQVQQKMGNYMYILSTTKWNKLITS